MKTTLTALQIEGNLLAPDMTAQMLEGSIKGQSPEDFGFNKTDKLADEIATAWGDAKAYWAAFQRALARLDENNTATSITRELWAVPLLQSLGYDPVYTATAEVVEGQTYAISHRAEEGENKPPIHIIGCRLEVDKRPPSGTPRLSAHALVQEYLNKTEHLWAIATNGFRWRLLRDSSLMTRLTYIEFDLEQILNGENFAEFGLFYRLFHRSRLPEAVDDADKCLLEYYHQEALQQGGRVRDKLRDGVEKALVQLGNGFIQHPQNEHLRQKLGIIPHYETEITSYEFYRQLLRLIYRLLFLMVAESRNLLLIGDDVEKARIYREYYSIERLRELAERPHWRREGFQDLWQGLRVTFLLFDENWRGEVLGLSPLNGDLFGSNTLSALDDCAIDNYDLLLAIRQLSLYQDKVQLRRVNYEYLDVEELGSVYESLLDFHPQVIHSQGRYEFALVFGSERKITGSYYTPPQLVQQLIKTALVPVIEEKLRSTKDKLRNSENNQELEKALLDLKVCDPACGSGHFLLAAARCIGKELAKVRTGEVEPGSEPLKLAIRDVIQNCIYGVDLNPLAVDLCKVALWIEGFPGKLPLTFLDHRIKCGNSLVGVLDINCLKEGIPDEAYKAVTG
ncbi:N-6 DNA methylase, partial [Tolypothrix sp. LEGE 11397]